VVIAALSLLAFFLISAEYHDLLGPALGTAEGEAGLARATRAVATSIVALDLALLILVGVASFLLARSAVQPLVLAREREQRFAADVAHELRTPLGAIASVAQSAREAASSEKASALETIARHAIDAGLLVGDLLTLARGDDRSALACEPVDLAALVRDEARAFHGDAQRRGIALEIEATPTIVDADARRLRQLARNLIENALNYARERVDLEVSQDGRFAVLRIDDDGPGVAPEVEGHIFERFVKGPGSQGSGIGLAMCRWVAGAHGGTIEHEGRSRFVVRLPLADGRSD